MKPIERPITHYVAGLLFDEQRKHVALIHKKYGPPAVVGRWNAIGGKVEDGETSAAAMSREFLEEAGVEISSWTLFLRLIGAGWKVDFYHAFSTTDLMRVRTCEEETVDRFPVSDGLHVVVPNLKWIIPMALGHFNENVSVYEVRENAHETD